MSWRDWIFGKPPALPGPELQQVRIDSAAVANLLTGLGGVDDKGAFARPNLSRLRLADSELTALYLNGGIAQRIVRLIPQEMTRKGWSVTDSTTDPDVLAEEDRRLRTNMVVREAATWSRLYGSAVVLMVTEEDVPEEFRDRPERLLATPLDPTKVKRIVALHAFDALEATPLVYEGDIRKPGYRDPLIWSISPAAIGVGTGAVTARVHASRVLHFRGVPRPPSFRLGGITSSLSVSSNNSLDDSVLQAVWDEVRNLSQTMAGGAVLAQEIRENVLKVSGLAGLLTAEQKSAVEERIRLIAKSKSLLGTVLIGQDDEFNSQVHSPSGFSELSGEAQAMLSAVTGIPQTILFGHTPAGLSTDNESGRQTFDRLISSEQEDIRSHLERFYALQFTAKEGPTKGKVPDDWELEFLPLDEETEAEKAAKRKLVAETDAIYLDRGVLSPSKIEESRFGPSGYQFELLPEGEEDIDSIDDPNEAAAELAVLDSSNSEPV